MTENLNPAIAGLPRLEEPCIACDATGVVWNREWREWSKGWDAARYPGGFDATVEYERQNPHPSVPEEGPCGECEGNGAVPTEAGRILLQFLFKWHGNWRHS